MAIIGIYYLVNTIYCNSHGGLDAPGVARVLEGQRKLALRDLLRFLHFMPVLLGVRPRERVTIDDPVSTLCYISTPGLGVA